MGGKKKPTKGHHSNMWGMLETVLVAAINKGQVPVVTTSLVLLVIAVRVPEENISKVFDHLFDTVVLGNFVGYALTPITLMAWFLHTKRQRRIYEREVRRVAKTRDDVQRKLLGDKFVQSSEV